MKMPSNPVLVLIGGLALFGAAVVPRAFNDLGRARGAVPDTVAGTAPSADQAAADAAGTAAAAQAASPAHSPAPAVFGQSAPATPASAKPDAPPPVVRSLRPEDRKPVADARSRSASGGSTTRTEIRVRGDSGIWVNGQRLEPRADGTIDPALLDGRRDPDATGATTRSSFAPAVGEVRGRLLRCAELPGSEAWADRQALAELEVRRGSDGTAEVNVVALNGRVPSDQASLCVMDALNAAPIVAPDTTAEVVYITFPLRF